MTKVPAVPCAHIADYYHWMWLGQKCIGFNLLRHGYRQWAKGYVLDIRANNLYDLPKPKRRKQVTSVKAILVRDFNWRMGNLRRLYHSVYGLQPHNADHIRQVVDREMSEQKTLHERRLAALEPENIDSADTFLMMAEEPVLADAIWRAYQNERENKRERL